MNYQEAIILFELPDHYVEEDIHASYRRLAGKHHPDKGGDPEIMKKVNEAKRLLEEERVNTNLIAIKKFEVALRTIENDKIQRKQNEKKVEKLETDARNKITGKLNSIKNVAYIASAISVGALFLGKEVPKEIFSLITPSVAEKPTVVEKPFLTVKIDKVLSKEKYDFGSSTEQKNNIDEATHELVNKYNYDLDKYNQYVSLLEVYQKQQNEISYYKKTWYFVMFYVAVSAGFFGWTYKNRSRKVESELDEFMSDLAIKSRYASALKEMFDGVLPKQWTLEQLEFSLVENDAGNNLITKLNYYLGTNKFSQLLIAKGLEHSFLNVVHGNEENDFEELYSLSAI